MIHSMANELLLRRRKKKKELFEWYKENFFRIDKLFSAQPPCISTFCVYFNTFLHSFYLIFIIVLISVAHHPPGVRKYVIWCLICGGILCLIGVMFLAVYFLLRSYTSTVGYFETVPPFVPSTLVSLNFDYYLRNF